MSLRSPGEIVLFESQEEQVDRATYWVSLWAKRMRKCGAEIIGALWHPSETVIGRMSTSNYSATEEDLQSPYERMEVTQVEALDASMTDLWIDCPWAFWAICRRHELGSMGMSRYERLAAEGRIPPGLYVSALEELIPYLDKKGLM